MSDTRIRGALDNLGLELGRNTIKRVLIEHGIERAVDPPGEQKKEELKRLRAHEWQRSASKPAIMGWESGCPAAGNRTA